MRNKNLRLIPKYCSINVNGILLEECKMKHALRIKFAADSGEFCYDLNGSSEQGGTGLH